MRPSWGWLLLALGLAVGGLGLLLNWSGGEPEPNPAQPPAWPMPSASQPAVAQVPAPPLPIGSQPLPPSTAPSAVRSDDLADHIPAGQVPTMKQIIEGLHERGIRTGIGAFNPPGTRPPLIGLAVPEDFELPPGYVRHYQATDDGQRIEAILMFSPDLKRVDASGRELNLPADRVVPPELAPP
ncbi:MAG: hypothetical protein ACK4F7_07725, partial [Inhella sp.]